MVNGVRSLYKQMRRDDETRVDDCTTQPKKKIILKRTQNSSLTLSFIQTQHKHSPTKYQNTSRKLNFVHGILATKYFVYVVLCDTERPTQFQSMINIYTLLSKAFFFLSAFYTSIRFRSSSKHLSLSIPSLLSLWFAVFHVYRCMLCVCVCQFFDELFFSFSHSENCHKNHSLLGM